MGENYIVINGKRAELTEEQLEQLGIKVSNNKRWRGNLDEKYYCVDTFNQVSSLEDINGDVGITSFIIMSVAMLFVQIVILALKKQEKFIFRQKK